MNNIPSAQTLAEILCDGDRADFRAQLSLALVAVFEPFERTLLLHMGAIHAAAALDLAGLQKFLTEAAELEAAAGLRAGSQHTLHQLALFSSNQGSIRPVASYYRATAATLRKQKNAIGLALCYRSLGEILLTLGKIPETQRYWGLAEQSLRFRNCPEAGQLQVWVAKLSPSAPPPQTSDGD